MSSHIEQFKVYDATFRPKRTDDLKPGVSEYIGRRGLWMYAWTIEEEDDQEYAGMVAMMPHFRDETFRGAPFAWVPECDLEIYQEQP